MAMQSIAQFQSCQQIHLGGKSEIRLCYGGVPDGLLHQGPPESRKAPRGVTGRALQFLVAGIDVGWPGGQVGLGPRDRSYPGVGRREIGRMIRRTRSRVTIGLTYLTDHDVIVSQGMKGADMAPDQGYRAEVAPLRN